MADRTLSYLITRVERELSQYPGTATQVYAKDAIADKIMSTFSIVFQDKLWKRFRTYERHTLDGVTGQIVDQFTEILDFDNINKIYPQDISRPLATLPLEYNPQIMAGGIPRYYSYSPVPGKLLKIWPPVSSGDIIVSGQMGKTEDFLLTDVVPFDDLTLIWGAAWQYALDDMTNPGAASKFQTLFDLRKKQIYNSQTDDPIQLTGNRAGDYPTSWSDYP